MEQAPPYNGYLAGHGELEERPRRRKTKLQLFVQHYLIMVFLMIGIGVGVGMGLGIRNSDPTFRDDKRRMMYLKFPGEIFMSMLKMIVLPIIITSIISGMASLPAKAAGKVGGATVLYYMTTTLVAVGLGILLVLTIRPGASYGDIPKERKHRVVHPADSGLDLIRNIFPNNLLMAGISQTRTEYETEDAERNVTRKGIDYVEKYKIIKDFKVSRKDASTNVLGWVTFCVVFGLVLGRMGDAGKPLVIWFNIVLQVISKIVYLIIWFSPVGIAFLLAERLVRMEDVEATFRKLGMYMATVLIGLAVHGFIILPLLLTFLARRNPFKFFANMAQALLTALGTASSSATLSVTMRCGRFNAGIDNRVLQFVLPVGATINMDGTALYEAVASIFIAQLNEIPLDAAQVVTIAFTSTLASIGAAGIPEAGLVTMTIVLTAVGLPIDDISLILAVDWFLDRCRTSINVWGDSVGSAIVAKEDSTLGRGEYNRGYQPDFHANGGPATYKTPPAGPRIEVPASSGEVNNTRV